MTFFISLLTLLAQIAVVILFLAFLTGNRKVGELIEKRATLLAFLAGLGAVLGSLYYSNIVGYTPCVLCWYQRYLMFPQVLILGLAAWKKYYVKRIVFLL